jgi:predicted transcriptional regulator
MAKSTDAPKAETIEKVVNVYKKTESITETALQTEISTTKVRKILITEGLWSSTRSQQIRELADQGKSSSEIAENLQISVTMVQNYLPYEKGLYDEPVKTDTAIRSEQFRKRNRTHAQKSRSREQQTMDGLRTVQEPPTPGEKKTPFAMQLHLELRNSKLEAMQADEAKILAKYGAVAKSISRDIIVPSSFALHQLHYLINMAFGWTNSHLHNFQLPLPLFQSLTKGKLLEIAPVFGYYLQFPNRTFNDEFWDDDYDESKSPRTWMRSKYLKQYKYGGHSEYWIENQTEIHDLANHLPILDVRPFRWKEKIKPRKVKFPEATLQDLLDAIIFDGGMPDALKESLRLSEILSMNPKDIESAKAVALATDNSSVALYKHYRDILVSEAKRKNGLRDAPTFSHAFNHMVDLQKKAEPNGIMPIATELLYSYDYGDDWEVDISLVREFGKDNQMVDDETAAKVIADCKPICIAKDGLNVLDDCGNVPGYINMLRTIHEGDRDEAKEMREWARGQGWTGRDVSPKHRI